MTLIDNNELNEIEYDTLRVNINIDKIENLVYIKLINIIANKNE